MRRPGRTRTAAPPRTPHYTPPMLTISRRQGERLLIGDDIVVEIVEVSGGTVRLGITAPKERRIYREELWEQIKRENEAAARADFSAPSAPAAPPDQG
jgi:carbon storage regulator